MRKLICFALAATLCSFSNSSAERDSLVVQAAKDNLNSFLSQIPAGSENQFGFADRDEINSASVGRPILVLNLTNEFYHTQTLSANNSIIESHEWRVPVVVNGMNKVLITVNDNNENYKAGNMSGAVLAKELQQAGAGLNSGDSYYILRIYPLESDFLVDAPGGVLSNASFIPLSSARMAMPSLSKKAYSETEVLRIIKTALFKNSKN